jgi:hypothetical protein
LDIERISEEIIFQGINFDYWLSKVLNKNYLNEFIRITDRKILSQGLCFLPQNIKRQITNSLSKNSQKLFLDDLNYYEHNAGQKEIISAQLKIVKKIKEVITQDLEQNYLDLFSKILLYDKKQQVIKLSLVVCYMIKNNK